MVPEKGPQKMVSENKKSPQKKSPEKWTREKWFPEKRTHMPVFHSLVYVGFWGGQ